jgi:spermidine synthase
VTLNFQELDHARTPYGELILRRRRALSMDGAEIYEVKLDGEFLMSSLVNQSEIALAELGLAALEAGNWHVVVGGLGLGYTAATALDHHGVRSVLVVEALSEVIAWHERGLVPLGGRVTGDTRCRLEHADFFARARDPDVGFDPAEPGRRFDAVLLDIDHSPLDLLHGTHADFYEPAGLRLMAAQLRPGGVFALWSAEPPEEEFTSRLKEVFQSTETHLVEYYNPLLDRDDINTVFVCRTADTANR